MFVKNCVKYKRVCGFMSIMKVIIIFIYMPLVCSELHTFMTTYTGILDGNTTGTFNVFAAIVLDGHQIGCIDSNKNLVPKPAWIKFLKSKDVWNKDVLIKENVQQIYKNNIHTLMQQFHQLKGVHQGMHGCTRRDKSNDFHAFHQYAYNGENFITLDLRNSLYITSVPEAKALIEKWNKDREQIQILKEYYEYQCVYWLWKFVNLNEDAFKRTEPKVSLLQKSPDSDVKCHVTGFYTNTTLILWKKNGQDISHSSALVKSGETLPNEDGTFQRTVTLRVSPNDWKEDQYFCVVKHMGKTIQKVLTEEEIKSNNRPTEDTYFLTLCVMALVLATFILAKKSRKRKAAKR